MQFGFVKLSLLHNPFHRLELAWLQFPSSESKNVKREWNAETEKRTWGHLGA